MAGKADKSMDYLRLAEKWGPALAKLLTKYWNAKDARALEIDRINDLFSDPVALAKQYIEPDFQQFNPANRPEDATSAELRLPALKHLDQWLAGERQSGRQMFVLADAGMGKTSLLMILKLTHLMGKWADTSDLNVCLLKLGPTTLDEIKALPAARRTVLLLDSLDEDSTVRGRVTERLTELLDATEHFRRVILTCRTQFFTGDDSPFNKRGQVAVAEHLVDVLYLGLFTGAQVDAYLHRRFPKKWHHHLTLRDNPKVALASPELAKMRELRFRPMLLAHVEDVLESTTEWTTYAMLEAMVTAWLQREKRKLRTQHDRTVAWETLRDACTTVARHMHAEDSRFISLEALNRHTASDPRLAHLKRMDVGGRALLNRTSDGAFRFAHQLVQEYLLVRWAASLPEDTKLRLRTTDAMRSMAWEQPNPVTALKLYETHQLAEGLPLHMVFVRPGVFKMGSPRGVGDSDERPQRTVRLHGFTLGRTAITQAQYAAVMGETPSTYEGPERPVERVSWLDAARFCNILSERLSLQAAYAIKGEAVTRDPAGDGFRLPTEAEWEYACRAGTTTRWSHGDDEARLGEYAWFDENSDRETHPVATLKPNPWGLHDMHGNIWELCQDRLDGYPKTTGEVPDPRGPSKGRARVLRGGSCLVSADYCRSAFRSRDSPGYQGWLLGFRVARSVPRPRA